MNPARLGHIVLLVSCIFLLQAVPSQAGQNEEQLFRNGNEAYSRGDYEQAIDHYEQLTAAAGFSPSVLFNLAGSYAEKGHIGKAILNYERALRLAPADADILFNLELLRKESGLFTNEPGGSMRFFMFLNLDQWAMVSLFSLICFTLLQIDSTTYRISRKTSAILAIFCLVLSGYGVAGTAFRYHSFHPAVVISPDARLLISPFTTAASTGTIQEGRLVYPEKTHETFTYVVDETNRKGWVLSTSLEAVVIPQ